jgi:hypothetical protein
MLLAAKERQQMKLTTNMVIQICSIIVVIGTALLQQTQVISGKAALIVGALVAVAQAIAAYFGHISNPDGTPASVAYVPPKP